MLFPQRDAKLFYKIVFGRWFLWLVIIFALACLYRFGIRRSDNQQLIKTEQLKNDKIKKAWHLLYKNGNSDIKHKIDKAYEEANK